MRTQGRLTAAALALPATLLLFAGLLNLGTAEAQTSGDPPRFWNGPSGWLYRQSIDVNNTNGNLSDYAVAVNFNGVASVAIPAGKMQADCEDVRFQLPNGVDLPYWFNEGSCNSAVSIAWVKVPFLPASGVARVEMYYGAPSAPRVSNPNQTFTPNSVRVEVDDCDPLDLGANCPITNHTQAEAVRARSPDFCVVSRPKVDYGWPCLAFPSGTDSVDRFSAEYRFLFVADVAGTWTFAHTADNWSEIATYGNDLAIDTSQGWLNTYGDNLPETSSSYNNSAGRGRWYSFVTSEKTGVETQRLRVARPGGSLQTLSSTNFPDMIFRRQHAEFEPAVVFRDSEQALPSATRDLTAEPGPGGGEVTLDWNAPSSTGGVSLTGYHIYHATSELGPFTSFINVTSGTEHTVTGLLDGTQYYFRVHAHTSRGLGPGATAVETTYDQPSAPQSFAIARGNRSATLTWTAPLSDGGESIDGFRIEKADVGPTPIVVASTTNGANTSFTVNGLENGTEYSFQVLAYNAAGDGTPTSMLPVTPAARPDPPASLTASPWNGGVTLGWTPGLANGAPLTGYHIWQGTSSGTETIVATTTDGTSTSFFVDGLTNGQLYFFNVTAINSVGVSASSNEVSATPARVPDPPTAAPTLVGNRSLTLNWVAGYDGGSSITNYHIYRLVGGDDLAYLASTGGANTTFQVHGLDNGQLYHFIIRAENAVGPSDVECVVSGTPGSVPYPPANVVVTPGNRSATVTWSAPLDDGGDPILGYTVECPACPDPELTTTGLTIDLTGLANGSTYSVAVRAQNSFGTGNHVGFVAFTPHAPRPDPPAALTATRDNGKVSLSWTPGHDGGSALTGYTIWRGTSSGGETVLATTTNGDNVSFIVNGLINGQTYFFNVTARNAIGMSASSNEVSAKPATTPGVPTISSAARANHSITLFFSAPASDGGEPLSGYDILVDSALVASTSNAANTTFIVNGLANGQTYSLQVSARNVVGPGAASAAISAIPAGPPFPASALTAARGNARVDLSWTNGSANGAAIATTYVYRGDSPSTLAQIGSVGGTTTAFAATGLTNGQTYYFALRHENAAGLGNFSVLRDAKPATTPSAPTGLTATRGNTSVALAWTAAFDGGEPRLGYDILSGPPGGTMTLVASTGNGGNTSFAANGLTNGVEVAFQVRGRNSIGAGALSSAASATPASVPDPPLLTSATRGNGQVALGWTIGANQGSALTSTRLLQGTSPDALSEVAILSASATTHTRTGLTNGVTYYFALRHVNAIGPGDPSNLLSAKPATTPSAPAGLTASFGDARVTLSWSAPQSNGGEPVASYTIHRGLSSSSLTPIATIGTNTSFVANGLTNGVEYWFRVVATNAVGAGPASALASATPARTPDAPLGLTAQAGQQQVSLDWDAPSFDGGRAITGYVIRRATGSGPLQVIQTIGTNTSYVSGNLFDGVTYRYTIAARNSVGEGPQSPETSATPISPPGAPATLTATTLEPAIQLEWSPPSSTGGTPVLQYRIFASSTPDGARWLVATVGGSTLGYTDDAEPATTRYYAVRALNAAGEGPESPEAFGATPANPLDPTVPDTTRTCTRDASTGAVACTQGSTDPVVGVGAGGRHSCALLADGRVDCWGDDSSGQSGDHLAGQPALAVVGGASHTCVVLDDGNVDCYGDNAFGKAASYLGGDATAVAAGGTHTCFLRASGAVLCQGSNGHGQSASRSSGVTAVATGASHTCFLLTGGIVDCQGRNDRGQAADDATGDVEAISAGGAHTCALTATRQVRCWGELDQPVPSAVQGATVQIASGRDHACARLTTGNVVCWGEDRDGQIEGHAGGNAVAIAAGTSHSCALLADETIVCWGAEDLSNYGQAVDYPTAEEPDASSAAPLQSSFHLAVIDLDHVRLARTEEA